MRELLAEAERTVNAVAGAVDNEPAGRVIRASGEPARRVLGRFRQRSTSESFRRMSMRRIPLVTSPVSAATGETKRHKGRQRDSVLAINGRICLRRLRWHCPEEGSQTHTDQLLDATELMISEGVHEMACRLNQDASSCL
jgi:hypothetical protein